MDTKINFDFVSPEESIVSSEVDMVQIPAVAVSYTHLTLPTNREV